MMIDPTHPDIGDGVMRPGAPIRTVADRNENIDSFPAVSPTRLERLNPTAKRKSNPRYFFFATRLRLAFEGATAESS
jgi:hypothetical protein